MVKKIIFSLFVLIFAISMISAYKTDISVKTLPDHEVQLTILDASTSSFVALERFMGMTDEYGDINFTYVSMEQYFDLIVYIKKDGEKIMPPKKLNERFPATEPIHLILGPSGFEPIYRPNITEENETIESNITTDLNQSLNESEEIVEESTSHGITGMVIGENGLLANKKFYYVLGILLLGIGAFFLYEANKHSIKEKIAKKPKVEGEHHSSQDIKVKKLSEIQGSMQDNSPSLSDAEKKLKEAQQEVERLRKVDEIRKRMFEDESELRRLGEK